MYSQLVFNEYHQDTVKCRSFVLEICGISYLPAAYA